MNDVNSLHGDRTTRSDPSGPLVPMDRFLDSMGGMTAENSRESCRLLEEGKILYFPLAPYGLCGDSIDVLLRQRQTSSRLHKNIAYRPAQDRVTGFSGKPADALRLHDVLRSFSQGVVSFVAALLPHYADTWRLDYASFRPLEEKGRQLRLNARNDLLHVDSFPKRPTYGDRILRVFLNINPSAPRHWITGDPFDALAPQVRDLLGPKLHDAGTSSWWRAAIESGKRLAKRPSASIPMPSKYDDLMRTLHQKMKQSQEFQKHCGRHHSSFPPGSGWMVFTDAVPHAVLSGQYALEQTLIVSRSAMVCPEKAPASVLERLCQAPIAKAA